MSDASKAYPERDVNGRAFHASTKDKANSETTVLIRRSSLEQFSNYTHQALENSHERFWLNFVGVLPPELVVQVQILFPFQTNETSPF